MLKKISKSLLASTSFRTLALAGVAAVALTPVALGAEGTETVVVTGTHIASPNLVSAAPVTLATSADIAIQGSTKVEDLLNQMPQVFAGQNANVVNGATGTSEVNLLGLGCDRNLVLLDGRRMPYGSAIDTCADLNQVPTLLVDHIEVLTGGASAAYGSDAVSGVVNFIMKKDFEGFQMDFQYGVYEHDNSNEAPGDIRSVIAGRGATNAAQFKLPNDSVWTGAGKQLSAIMGMSSANGKGNMTAFFSYRQNDAILEGPYDYSACALAAPTKAGKWTCGGSDTSFPGRFTDFSNYSFTLDPATGNTFTNYNGATGKYNYGPLNYYQRPDERFSAGVFGHYQAASFAEIYTQIMYTDYRTLAQIAPSGDFGNAGSSVDANGTTYINCGNPMLSSTQKTQIGCDAGMISTDASVPMYILRRNVEGGGRVSDLENTSFRALLGVKGSINDAWSYDFSGTYSKVSSEQIYKNDFSITRMGRALDVIDVGGVATCRAKASGVDKDCVPWNIFKVGGVTQEALNYLQIPMLEHGYTNQLNLNVNMTGDLTKYGVVSPWAKTGVSVYFGAEYRQDTLSTTTDTSFSTKDGAGQGGATKGLDGAAHVAEGFVEAKVPVIEGMPFAKAVTLDLTYRYSAYDRITTNTWGTQASWTVLDDITFRGSFERAVRAPNVVEMFLATGMNLTDSITSDPCGLNHDIGGHSVTQAECASTPGTGAASWYGKDLDSPAGQYNYQQGGNQNLQAEKAETWSLGFVLTPTFLSGLSITADYYSVQLHSQISNVDPLDTMYACYALHNAAMCSNIHRTAGGMLWLGNGYIDARNTNIGGTKTSGVNYAITYQGDLADVGLDGAGVVGLSVTGNYLNRLTTDSGVGTINPCVGWYGSSCGAPNMRWRQVTRLTWSAPWYNIDVTGTWRFFGGVKQYNGDTTAIDYRWPSRSYFDLSVGLPVYTGTDFRVGVNNLFDNDPPLSWVVGTAGNGNTYPQVYDSMGRYLFMQLTVKM